MNNNFAEKIKTARLNKKLTQIEVSKKIGIHQSVIAKIENNKLEPNINNLKMLCKLYDISADWLLGLKK